MHIFVFYCYAISRLKHPNYFHQHKTIELLSVNFLNHRFDFSDFRKKTKHFKFEKDLKQLQHEIEMYETPTIVLHFRSECLLIPYQAL
ncbi:hypothetical protein CCP2SC5_40029 [Azospirillaceae bacterium]